MIQHRTILIVIALTCILKTIIIALICLAEWREQCETISTFSACITVITTHHAKVTQRCVQFVRSANTHNSTITEQCC